MGTTGQEKNIIFYTINCSNCNVLKRKLDEKQIVYKLVEGDEAREAMLNAGMTSAPMLKIDDKNMSFIEAIKWVRLWK